MTDTAPEESVLPPWRLVLVVVAHPDDESFALGALVDRWGREGAEVTVLCLTRGEASTLGADVADLSAVRHAELSAAADALGVGAPILLGHPDGRLWVITPTQNPTFWIACCPVCLPKICILPTVRFWKLPNFCIRGCRRSPTPCRPDWAVGC